MKVVLVDDSTTFRERLASLCSRISGVDVVAQAGDRVEADKVIKEWDPDAVILDIKMPLGSGFDVLQRVKRSSPSCKVIILTNYPLEPYRKKAEEMEADYFFSKSTEFVNALTVLEQLAISEEPQT